MDNYISSTKKILQTLQLKHTNTYIKDNILSHPDYPSLLSVSDTLEKYNIDTLAIKINAERLEEAPLPYIVQVEERNNPLFYVLTKIDKNTIAYYNENNKIFNETKDGFLSKWTGICLLVEKTESSQEPNIEQSIR